MDSLSQIVLGGVIAAACVPGCHRRAALAAGAALGTLQFNYPLAQVMQYPLFFGGSLEAGQLWGRGQEPSLERTVFGGSVYTALDTPLGPIYFGLGLAEGGEEAVFFRLGQPD